jgi:hypothetical protein
MRRRGRALGRVAGRVATVLTVLSVVLSGVAVESGVAAAGPAESPGAVDAGAAAADLSDLFGSGQPTDPYLLTDAEDLQSMAADLSAHYALANDIDAAETAAWNGGRGFAPVGAQFDPFTGSLDGRGYTITGLTIDRPRTGYVGLFGRVYGGYVTDVHFEDARVVGGWAVGSLAGAAELSVVADATATGSVTGDTWVGGLVGVNEGFVQVLDASTAVTVRGDRDVGGLVGSNLRNNLVRDSLASGPVIGEGADEDRDDRVGGLVGSNRDRETVVNSHATGKVTGTGSDVGGLVGLNEGHSVVLESSASGDVTARAGVGALVGENRDSTVADSRAAGAVVATSTGPVSLAGGLVGLNEQGLVHRTAASGPVTASGSKVGGLVGENRGGTVSRSSATGAVTGGDEVGGLVGLSIGGVLRSYALGAVNGTALVGGLVGYNWIGDVSRSYAAGPVAGDGPVGGLVGFSLDGTVAGSYWDLEASGQSVGVGTGDDTTVDGASGLPTAAMTGVDALSGMSALDFPDEWRGTDGYPVLAWQVGDGGTDPSGAVEGAGTAGDAPAAGPAGAPEPTDLRALAGAGTPEDPHRIATVADLDAMRTDPGAHYVLAADVDAAETAAWNAGRGMASIEGPFTGSFDGAGHTISGLRVDGPGLFATLDRRGDVRDFRLEDVDVNGIRTVGGVVGRNDGGTVTGVTVTGSVRGTGDAVGGVIGSNDGGTVTDSTAAATVEGRDWVGGLVGANFGGVVGASTVGPGATVTGQERVGGLVGRIDRGTVVDSSAAATVAGAEDDVGGLVGRVYRSTVLRSAATGSVTGFADAGGLVGDGYLGTVIDGTADATVEGTGTGDRFRQDGQVGGLVGRSEESVVVGAVARGSVRGAADNTGGLLGANLVATTAGSYATASVSGDSAVGGLVGWNLGPVYGSYAAGPVSGSTATGGFAGDNAWTTLHAYYDREATGAPRGGGVGLATAQMTGGAARDAMPGLDYGTDWYLTPSYPVLAREGAGPFLYVSVNHTLERVEAGETLRATSRVGNYGGAVGRGTVSLSDEGFGELRRDAVSVDLDPREVTHPVLEWRTGPGDVGNGTMTVATPHHSTSWDVEVVEVPGRSPFDGPVPGSGGRGPPNDFDADGKYEDVDGDADADFGDAVALAFVDASALTPAQTTALDFDDDGDVDFDDAVELAFLV